MTSATPKPNCVHGTKRNSLHFEGLGQFLPLASSSLTPHVGCWQEAVKLGGASSGSATHPMYGPAVLSKFSENRSRGHRRKCLLLAQSRHAQCADECPLSGVKRTSLIRSLMSANDPKQHWKFQAQHTAHVAVLLLATKK